MQQTWVQLPLVPIRVIIIIIIKIVDEVQNKTHKNNKSYVLYGLLLVVVGRTSGQKLLLNASKRSQ